MDWCGAGKETKEECLVCLTGVSVMLVSAGAPVRRIMSLALDIASGRVHCPSSYNNYQEKTRSERYDMSD